MSALNPLGLIPAETVCQEWHCTAGWLRRVPIDELPKYKIGRKTFYAPADLRAYLRANRRAS